jgi:hypothetical protein
MTTQWFFAVKDHLSLIDDDLLNKHITLCQVAISICLTPNLVKEYKKILIFLEQEVEKRYLFTDTKYTHGEKS